MFKRSVDVAGVLALCAAVVFSVLWLRNFDEHGPTWEAMATVLALVAAVTGIPAQRWAAARERRTLAWEAVVRERNENLAVLADHLQPMTLNNARRRVYPRLSTSALTMAVSSGAFTSAHDEELFADLLDCQNDIHELNQRLELVELRMFLSPTRLSAQDLVDLDRPLFRTDGYVAVVKESLERLSD